jgi:hypothetical protein
MRWGVNGDTLLSTRWSWLRGAQGTYTRTTARALAKDLNLFYDKVRRMRAQNLATESEDAAHG